MKRDYRDIHTFVICTYKDSPYLEECLLAISKQTVKSSVIISTSTPTEKLKQIADKYGVQIVTHSQGGSIGKDWNYGFAYADTEYVTITHQDDIYLPRYAEVAIKSLASYEADVFFSNYSEINDDTHMLKRNANLLIKDFMLMPLLISKRSAILRKGIMAFGSPICCPAVTYNKKNLQNFRFSEELQCALDWEAYTRINKARGTWVYCPDRLVLHRIHPGSATTEMIGNSIRTQEELNIFKEYWPKQVAKALSLVYSSAQRSNCK